MKAHSIYTTRAVAFVAANPGCCKFDLARALTNNARRCPSKQYYLVNTQIRLGNIVAFAGNGNRYELYTPEVAAAMNVFPTMAAAPVDVLADYCDDNGRSDLADAIR